MNEPISQQLVKSLSNVCFSGFVMVVLVLTVIAVTYQPPDPFVTTGGAISKVFSSVENATFLEDESVIRTGEDFAVISPVPAEAPILLGDVDSSHLSHSASLQVCNPRKLPIINCSDPGVLSTIIEYNLEHYPNLNFFAYQTPLPGAEKNQCDVSWRFRSKKEKSWRLYRDFRRFSLVLNYSCDYVVNQSHGWHSGLNAKHLFRWRNGTAIGARRPKPRTASSKNSTIIEELEVIDDKISTVADLEINFKDHRFLYYSRGGDHCKSMNHYLWSFTCALGEAHYLNRTLVMDMQFCLSGTNNPGHEDEDGKDFRLYFDFVHLKDAASVIEHNEFRRVWKQWNQKHNRIHAKIVNDFKVTPMQLQQDESTVLMRTFQLPEPNNYWFRVCEGETEKVIQRPWHLLWKSKRIMDIVTAICGQMEWDFDAVHVVRGDKATNKDLWPNLGDDTSVESLIEKLGDQLNTTRNVYVATNEKDPHYFRQLKQAYSHAYSLDDFSALWDKNSVWYNQTLALTDGQPVEFDGYMRVEVDTEVMYRAKKRFETFGFLTKDCKDGIHTC